LGGTGRGEAAAPDAGLTVNSERATTSSRRPPFPSVPDRSMFRSALMEA